MLLQKRIRSSEVYSAGSIIYMVIPWCHFYSKKGIFGAFGIVPVSDHKSSRSYDKFTRLSHSYFPVVFIQNFIFRISPDGSQGDGIVRFRGFFKYIIRTPEQFRRPIRINEFDMWPFQHQCPQLLHGKYFAPEPYPSQGTEILIFYPAMF